MEKLKKYICLSLFIIILLSANLTVYASNTAILWSDWSVSEKANFIRYKFTALCSKLIGVVTKGDDLEPYLADYYADNLAIENGMTYEEWIASNVSYNESSDELTFSDEFMDTMKLAVDTYVKANSNPWSEVQTINARDINLGIFETKAQYNAFVDYVKSNNVLVTQTEMSYQHYYRGESGELLTENKDIRYFTFYTYSLENSFTYSTDYVSQDFYRLNLYAYDDNWEHIGPIFCQIDESGNIEELDGYYRAYLFLNPQYKPWLSSAYTQGECVFRLYNTLNDLKQYTVGQRKWLAGNQYYNYDSSQDNSVTLTNSDLTNSSLYGDVYNYVIDNGGDSLTENELRDILDDYLNGFNNNGGGSSGSGNSSGGGLGGLLSGLGSLGDAILAILGKLIEYIAKALSLLTNTVTDFIDIVPQNITALLVALFPFLPQEWITGIELSIVLGVIVGIVGLFKK